MNQKPINKEIERDSNIELLRIVLMIMVIAHHLIIRCNPDSWNKTIYLTILNTFAIIAVDCFIFVSGYYGIKFKVKTLISFILQGIIYSAGAYILYNAILSPEKFSLIDLLKRFFPLTFPIWWFLNAYIGVYLLAPFINKGIETLKAYQSGGIILTLLYLSSNSPLTGYNFYSDNGGHGLFTMLLMYMIARYCGKYIKSLKKAIPLYICIYLFTFTCVIGARILGKTDLVWRLISYNCPLIILGAICFFYSFKKIKLKSKTINKIAPLTFGVYLIHETPENIFIVKKIIVQINNTIENPLVMSIIVIAMSILLFILCASIEKIRQMAFNPIVDAIDKKASVLLLKIKSITPQ